MAMLPNPVPGRKVTFSDDLQATILVNRSVLLTCGKAVYVVLTPEEAAALYAFLHKNKRTFVRVGGQP
jgi:hypothetical protein